MREYSPKRRTALVLTGSGTSGAYHAGVLKALDESGVKIDLVVGSGIGTVAAAYSAVAGGPKLYGESGFWQGLGWDSLYRLRADLRLLVLLLGASIGVFLVPVALALIAGLLFPLALILDLALPGLLSRLAFALSAAPIFLRSPYLGSIAAPVFLLALLAAVYLGLLYLRGRRRFAERFESLLDARPAERRLAQGLWEIARGAAPGTRAPAAAELGRRYVALASENLGQPGFKELIVRAADLETGSGLAFVLLGDAALASFAGSRGRGKRARVDGVPDTIDLRSTGYDVLLLDAVLTGLLPPLAAQPRRVAFPRGGVFGGETHRLSESMLAGGSGIAEAIAAGAEQVVVAAGVPESPQPLPRRRGPRALADGVLGTLERRAVEADVRATARINRMVETLGHHTEGGGHAWEDPASGRLYRDVALYVIRPERRPLGPLDLDGAQDPSTEVLQTPADLIEAGYKDAYRLFVEPVVGAVPEPARKQRHEAEQDQPGQAVEL
jgi:hypothetical protein